MGAFEQLVLALAHQRLELFFAGRRLLVAVRFDLGLDLGRRVRRRVSLARRVRILGLEVAGAGIDSVLAVLLAGLAVLVGHRHGHAERRALAALGAVEGDGLATEYAAGARGGAGHRGCREIVGDAGALLLGRRVEQPQQQEERHHRGHEVGIGHLPGAAVVAVAVSAFLFADDDGGCRVARHAVLPTWSAAARH